MLYLFLRTAWWAIAVLSILLFLVAMPVYFAQLDQVCLYKPCLAMQLSIGQAIILELRGLSLRFYAELISAFQILLYLANLAIGVFLYARKSKDWLAILVSLMLLTSIQADLYRGLMMAYPGLSWLATGLGLLNSILLIIFFFIFPTGNFQPRWTVGLAALWVAVLSIYSFWSGGAAITQSGPTWSVVFFLIGLVVTGFTVLFYRYHFIFNIRQRAQTRWVVFGVLLTWGGELLLELLRVSSPLIDSNAVLFIIWNILVLGWSLIFPISILIAILSSALMDIDVLIRRTLAYAILTISLLLVYVFSVLGLQKIFELATGQSSPAIAILSTLLIAGLFTPLRNRIQESINQIFYRKQYNMEMAVQEFTSKVREDVDLEEISTALMLTVRETLQPEFYSLWMCRVNPELESHQKDYLR